MLKHVIDYGEMYHLYIFDIEMLEMNGLQLAKEIRKIDAKALFVFLTGYTQYVMDVFEVITFDYISKPITVEKLESVLLKAMQYLHMIKRDFVFQFRKNQFRISCDDIVYFEKKGRQKYGNSLMIRSLPIFMYHISSILGISGRLMEMK